MNTENFWREQSKKNEVGKPKYSVTTDPNTEEEKFMAVWIDKWERHFSYFYNAGCGCCVNIYEFDAPQEAINEISDELAVNSYEELHRPIRSGSPSNFSEFIRSIDKDKKNIR